MAEGTIRVVIGPVVDIEFKKEGLPPINNALRLLDKEIDLVLEVHQHIGDNIVKCIALSPTEGLKRGMKVEDTGSIRLSTNSVTLPRIGRVRSKEATDIKGSILSAAVTKEGTSCISSQPILRKPSKWS